MAHKEWEPDDFLNEFLDFDYRKPVPEHSERISKGLPSEKTTANAQQNIKNHGLDDDVKLYESMRANRDKQAGTQASAQTRKQSLRSSGALLTDIPEPLSSRRKTGSKSGASHPVAAGKAAQQDRAHVKPGEAAPVRSTEPAQDRSALSSVLSDIRQKGSHIHASELASGALSAAKKLVSSSEDIPPEEIPPAISGGSAAETAAAYSTDGALRGASHAFISDAAASGASPAGEKDELAELFAELGETSGGKLSADENEALRQAQQDAYDRYRGNYSRNSRKKNAAGRAGAFSRWLSRIYVVALAAFGIMMAAMDVLPLGMLIALYVILGLLSVIIVAQLRRKNVRRWTRALASVTALCLILLFGVGAAYSMGTLSFLDVTSVENANKVASVTKQPFNVCITGIDVDGTIDEEGRSDVNMIVTVNPQTQQILMTSIPRDYQIYMPDKDYAMDKLTHTGFYGVDTTIGAEESLLETTVNYYVKVNFSTVMKFVDAIGGVDVYSEYEFTPVKMKRWTVQEGWNHMDGRQALSFARERKAFIDGDNQRIKNQQAVFEAIIKKATSSRTMLMSYNKILSSLRDYFQMSFSSSELRSLLKLQLSKNPEWKIYKNTIIGGDGSLPTYSTGNAYAYVMTQDQESIDNAKALINAVLEGQMLDKDDDGNVYVTGGDESGESEGTEE